MSTYTFSLLEFLPAGVYLYQYHHLYSTTTSSLQVTLKAVPSLVAWSFTYTCACGGCRRSVFYSFCPILDLVRSSLHLHLRCCSCCCQRKRVQLLPVAVRVVNYSLAEVQILCSPEYYPMHDAAALLVAQPNTIRCSA